MKTLALGLVVLILLVACTLVQVDVSSDDEGTTTIEPNGINVTVHQQATGKARQP